MMKRILSLCAMAALCLSLLSACGGGDNPKGTEPPSEPAGGNTAALDPTQQPTQAPPTEEPPADPTDAPVEQPTDQPQSPDGPVDLASFAVSMTEGHEFGGFLQRMDPEDPNMGEMMGDMLNNYYPGLTGLELEQMEVYISMISFGSGELAAGQVKDPGDANKVKEIFQARVDAKSTEGAGNYPEEVELWQRSSKVAANGDYVLLVCAEDCDAIVSEFNALFQ